MYYLNYLIPFSITYFSESRFYSPSLANPNFLFSSLKNAPQGCDFAVHNKLKWSLHEQHFCQDFCATGIQCQKQRGKSYIDNEGDFVDK